MRRQAAWDLRLAARSGGLAAVAAAAVLVVIATTDGGAAWTLRLAMWGALLPVAGAIGSFTATELASARGELRALSAVGVDPSRAIRGAVLGGIVVSIVGPLVALSPASDLAALFPRATAARVWVLANDGSLRELTQGLVARPDGSLELVESVAAASSSLSSELPRGTALATLAALTLAAFAAPLSAAVPTSGRRKVLVAGLTVLALIIAFQSVAANRAPAVLLVLGPAFALADGVLSRYRAARDPA